jgi:hypothetical protein
MVKSVYSPSLDTTILNRPRFAKVLVISNLTANLTSNNDLSCCVSCRSCSVIFSKFSAFKKIA